MTHPSLLLLLALVVAAPVVLPAQGHANFTGTWKIASVAPPVPAGRGRGAAGGGIGGPYAETMLAQAPETMVVAQNATTLWLPAANRSKRSTQRRLAAASERQRVDESDTMASSEKRNGCHPR